jgi:hypothetical protein
MTALMKDSRGDITLSFPVGGRLTDPRFDFRDAIWGALRTVAVNAITLPVSWIGRVQFGPDSRIQQIQVDPVTFEPGTATLTSEGRAQVSGLVAFLQQLPEPRIRLAPIVSSRDVGELRRRTLEVTIDRVVRDRQLSREAAAARLFEQRFPDRPAPNTPEEMLAALLRGEPMPTSKRISELATQRLEAVRALVKQGEIDTTRLVEMKLVQRDDAAGQIELEVLEPDILRPSKVREVLQRLGVPLKPFGVE